MHISLLSIVKTGFSNFHLILFRNPKVKFFEKIFREYDMSDWLRTACIDRET